MGGASAGISGVGGRIFNMENVDSGSANVCDLSSSATKNFKFGGSGSGATGSALAIGSSTPNMSTTPSASSKVKASHKLKQQTSRIVSSFKQQSVVCSVVREFNGHKVGHINSVFFFSFHRPLRLSKSIKSK